MLSVSVVVCAYSSERVGLLRAALNSLLEQDYPASEIILVVDYNPELRDCIASAYPTIRCVANDCPQGLSGARNTGMRLAEGDIVAFLDDDAIAEPDWVRRTVARYSDPLVVGTGGQVNPIWPTARPFWFPDEFDWVVGCSYRGLPVAVASVRNPIGCNMSFRRSSLEEVGGFSPNIGRAGNDAAGCEETELSIRMLDALPGSRILYDPSVVVKHHVSCERTTWRYFYRRCFAEGRSKALVAAKVGAGSALRSEMRYTTRTLPGGVLRNIGVALARGDLGGLARAATIVAGFGCTVAGYLQAKLAIRNRRPAPDSDFSPIRIVDLDVDELPEILRARDGGSGERYGGVFCLVRRAGRPLGVVEMAFQGDEITFPELKAQISKQIPNIDRELLHEPVGRDREPYISVVIATRDRAASLAACIDSLLLQDYSAFEIVVVDNAPSTSETATLIAERYADTGKVKYVREDWPGLGHAHNRGWASVSASIIAFTDDDVVVDRGWLAAIASAFASDENVGCVTGLILPAELQTRAQYWTERHGGFGKGFERVAFDLKAHKPSDPLFPFTAGQLGSGANMAFRKDVLAHIGGFDPALGAGTKARGGDDLAALFGVIEAGYQVVYEPAALLWHRHRRSEEGMRRQAYGYGVGLGAYLTKVVWDRPSTALRFLAALPSALKHVFGASSAKNLRLPEDYPRSLVWRERLGILMGVPSYVRSRLSTGQAVREPARVPIVFPSVRQNEPL